MTQNAHLIYRKDIDGLRAIAVLSVVGFHAFPQWIPGGFVGVDIFFVISGYLISSILFKTLDNGNFSFIDFYQKRVKRILPSLLIVLTFCYIAGWFSLLGSDFTSLGKHLAYGVGFFSNFILLSESGYFDTAAEYKPLLHLWSLGIEEQFYVIWPLVAVLTYRKRKLFISITIAMFICSLGAGFLALYNEPNEVFYLPQYRAWELLLGALLAYRTIQLKTHTELIHTSKSIALANIKAIFGLTLILASIFFTNKYMPFINLPATFGTVLLISASNNSYINRNFLSNLFLVFLGLISYPLYLWHWPILVFSKQWASSTPTKIDISITIFISILLAYLTYRFIELPVKKASRITAIILLGIACVISGVGYWTFINDGVISRFPESVQYLVNTSSIYAEKTKIWQDYQGQRGCFLPDGYKNNFQKFNNECMTANSTLNNHSLFLWGDSFSAILYSGIMDVKKTHPFTFSQYSVGACPPLIKIMENTHCNEYTKFIMEKIIQVKPNTIVLSARWEFYELNSNLTETIKFLKQVGIKHIIVVGMPPIWNEQGSYLPQILLKRFLHSMPHTIPDRILLNDFTRQKDIDDTLNKISKDNDIIYISPFYALCNELGCLTRWGEKITDLTSLDFGHLTESTSIYIMKNKLSPVLENIWGKQEP